jgi:hypothetical protein
MASECFGGCGLTIPRFPLGLRSINKRGKLVSERLAWAEAVADANQKSPEWVEDGRAILAELRGAMHGEIDPRMVEEARVRHWQEYGWGIEIAAKEAGLPVINEWLPSHAVDARRVAAGVDIIDKAIAELPDEGRC